MTDKIIIPTEASKDTIILALHDARNVARDGGYQNTADRYQRIADYIDEHNPADPDDDDDAPTPTATGCECDCAGRDSHEIPLYLTIDELHAVDQIMQRITFGDLTNDDDIVQIHRAQKEIRETGQRHLR